MSEMVKAVSSVKVTVHPNCKDDVFLKDTDTRPTQVCEYLVYLTVPKMGGDGLLIGVTETPEAAEAIASALNTVFGFVHTHI